MPCAAGSTAPAPTSNTKRINAHSWDIAGALAAGLRAAFIQRPDQALSPLGLQPEVAATDLLDAARQISGK